MKIYSNSTLSSQFQRVRFKTENGYLGKLVGINIVDEDRNVYVNPVYRYLLRIERHPGQLLIEIALGLDRSLIISFSGRGIETQIITPTISDIGKEEHA